MKSAELRARNRFRSSEKPKPAEASKTNRTFDAPSQHVTLRTPLSEDQNEKTRLIGPTRSARSTQTDGSKSKTRMRPLFDAWTCLKFGRSKMLESAGISLPKSAENRAIGPANRDWNLPANAS